MDLHKFIGETRKVTENDLMQEEEVELAQAPVVDDELISQLCQEMPDCQNVDQEEFRKGLETELTHFDTVGGDINVVAGLAMDNIQKYPGQKYYTALEQLQTQLGSAQEQEAPPEQTSPEPMAEEPVGEEQAVVTEEPTVESKIEEENTTATSTDSVKDVAKSEKLAKEEVKDIKKENKALDKEASKGEHKATV